MTQIRDEIFQVSYSELGEPQDKGFYAVPGTGAKLLLDEADVRYIREYLDRHYEPSFFIRKSKALRGAFTVIARQRL